MSRKFVNLWSLINIFKSNIPILYKKNPNENLILNNKDIFDNLIGQLLDAKEQYIDSSNKGIKDVFKRKIRLLNNKIDTIIFEKYGLTEEDFRLMLIKNYNN